MSKALGRTVYVMAPRTIYNSIDKYRVKIGSLKNKFPGIKFIFPHDKFYNAEDWLEQINEIISQCDSGILISNNGIIGRGCYIEVGMLKEQNKPVFYLDGTQLMERFSMRIILGGEDGQCYAHVMAK